MPAFAPLLGENPSCLILGSMPGQASLQQQRYYAHSQNAFWWVMARIVGFQDDLSYQEKCQALTAAGFAVWDVLFDCTRPGSLDSSIKQSTEVVNDFGKFLQSHNTIKKIAFNGGAAEAIFKRRCQSSINHISGVQFCKLPSTSPAHARMTRQQKFTFWQRELLQDD